MCTVELSRNLDKMQGEVRGQPTMDKNPIQGYNSKIILLTSFYKAREELLGLVGQHGSSSEWTFSRFGKVCKMFAVSPLVTSDLLCSPVDKTWEMA